MTQGRLSRQVAAQHSSTVTAFDRDGVGDDRIVEIEQPHGWACTP
jgi:hypothetical protein